MKRRKLEEDSFISRTRGGRENRTDSQTESADDSRALIRGRIIKGLRPFILGLSLLLLPAAAWGSEVGHREETEAEDSPFVENEWGFVSESMDVSEGIPENIYGRLEMIRSRGVLRVAMEPDYAPQEFIDPALPEGKNYVGADVELAKRIAERMGVELEIVPMVFSQVLPAVVDGECDLAISALSFTPSRAAIVELSKGYLYSEENAYTALVVRQEETEEITSIEDLEDKKLVAQAGSIQESLLAENIQRYHQFRRVSSSSQVYELVEEGSYDVGGVNAQQAEFYISSHPDCGLVSLESIRFALIEEYQGDRVAGRKGDLPLLYFVNGVIDQVLEEGLYDQWMIEYGKKAASLGLMD